MTRTALGYLTLATIRTAPPQCTQVLHVDVEDALEALLLSHRTAALVGRAVVGVRVDVSRLCIGGRPFAAPRGRHLRAQVGVRDKDAVKSCQVRAWWRLQRRQPAATAQAAVMCADRVPSRCRGTCSAAGNQNRLRESLRPRNQYFAILPEDIRRHIELVVPEVTGTRKPLERVGVPIIVSAPQFTVKLTV